MFGNVIWRKNLTNLNVCGTLNTSVGSADFLCQYAPLVCAVEFNRSSDRRRTRGFLLEVDMPKGIYKHKPQLLTMIRKEAFSFDDSLYEIFYDNLSGEMELLAVKETGKIRNAVPIKWLVGKNRQIILRALRPVKKEKIDLQADFVENGVGTALGK